MKKSALSMMRVNTYGSSDSFVPTYREDGDGRVKSFASAAMIGSFSVDVIALATCSEDRLHSPDSESMNLLNPPAHRGM